jgi:uncharacterized protein YycO
MAKRLFQKIKHKAIGFTGHVMFQKYPCWFIYRPDIHRVRGSHVRQILESVWPGDILLRRFDGYLNTIFTPGFWGHAGFYVGGHVIVHSIGTGCCEEDILNFCRADAVAVLRPGTIPGSITKARKLADEHTPYDYDFRGDNKKYYCTELVDFILDGMFTDDYSWRYGQKVLTPDGIFKSNKIDQILTINYKEK